MGCREASRDPSCLLTAEHGSLPDGGFIECDALSPGDELDIGDATGNLCHVARSLKRPLRASPSLTLAQNVGLDCLTH